MFDKLFKKNKNANYFLEFPTKTTQAQPAVAEEETVAQAQPPVTEEEKVAESTSEPREKKASATTKEQAQITEKTKSKVKTQAQVNVSYDPPEWVKAMKNYSDQGIGNSSESTDNFAGKYVTNDVPMSRRRPGPSLNMFKDMASKMGS